MTIRAAKIRLRYAPRFFAAPAARWRSAIAARRSIARLRNSAPETFCWWQAKVTKPGRLSAIVFCRFPTMMLLPQPRGRGRDDCAVDPRCDGGRDEGRARWHARAGDRWNFD